MNPTFTLSINLDTKSPDYGKLTITDTTDITGVEASYKGWIYIETPVGLEKLGSEDSPNFVDGSRVYVYDIPKTNVGGLLKGCYNVTVYNNINHVTGQAYNSTTQKIDFTPEILDEDGNVRKLDINKVIDCFCYKITADDVTEYGDTDSIDRVWTVFIPQSAGGGSEITSYPTLEYTFEFTNVTYEINLESTVTYDFGALNGTFVINELCQTPIKCDINLCGVVDCYNELLKKIAKESCSKGGRKKISEVLQEDSTRAREQIIKFETNVKCGKYSEAQDAYDELVKILSCDCNCGGEPTKVNPYCGDVVPGIPSTVTVSAGNCIDVTITTIGGNTDYEVAVDQACLESIFGEIEECILDQLGELICENFPPELVPDQGSILGLCDAIAWIVDVLCNIFTIINTADPAEMNFYCYEDCFETYITSGTPIPVEELFSFIFAILCGEPPECAQDPCEQIEGDVDIRTLDWELDIEYIECIGNGRFHKFQINWDLPGEWRLNVGGFTGGWETLDNTDVSPTKEITVDVDPDGDGVIDYLGFYIEYRVAGTNYIARNQWWWFPSEGCSQGIANNWEIRKAGPTGRCIRLLEAYSLTNTVYDSWQWTLEGVDGVGDPVLSAVNIPSLPENQIYLDFTRHCNVPGECDFLGYEAFYSVTGTLTVGTPPDETICEIASKTVRAPECCGCLPPCEEFEGSFTCNLIIDDQGNGQYGVTSIPSIGFYLLECDPPNTITSSPPLPPPISPDGLTGGVDGLGNPVYTNNGTVPQPGDCDTSPACGWLYRDIEIVDYNGMNITVQVTGPDPQLCFKGTVEGGCEFCCCGILPEACLVDIRPIDISICYGEPIVLPIFLTEGVNPFTVTIKLPNDTIIYQQTTVNESTSFTLGVKDQYYPATPGATTFTIVITDAEGCTNEFTANVLLSDCENCTISATPIQQTINLCMGDSTSISTVVSDFDTQVTWTLYYDYNGAGTLIDSGISTDGNIGFNVTANSNYPEGEYTLIIVDDLDCNVTLTFTLNHIDCPEDCPEIICDKLDLNYTVVNGYFNMTTPTYLGLPVDYFAIELVPLSGQTQGNVLITSDDIDPITGTLLIGNITPDIPDGQGIPLESGDWGINIVQLLIGDCLYDNVDCDFGNPDFTIEPKDCCELITYTGGFETVMFDVDISALDPINYPPSGIAELYIDMQNFSFPDRVTVFDCDGNQLAQSPWVGDPNACPEVPGVVEGYWTNGGGAEAPVSGGTRPANFSLSSGSDIGAIRLYYQVDLNLCDKVVVKVEGGCSGTVWQVKPVCDADCEPDCNLMLGLGADCTETGTAVLLYAANGGSGDYTFTHNGSPLTSNPWPVPVTNTTYEITVTDNVTGCTRTSSLAIPDCEGIETSPCIIQPQVSYDCDLGLSFAVVSPAGIALILNLEDGLTGDPLGAPTQGQILPSGSYIFKVTPSDIVNCREIAIPFVVECPPSQETPCEYTTVSFGTPIYSDVPPNEVDPDDNPDNDPSYPINPDIVVNDCWGLGGALTKLRDATTGEMNVTIDYCFYDVVSGSFPFDLAVPVPPQWTNGSTEAVPAATKTLVTEVLADIATLINNIFPNTTVTWNDVGGACGEAAVVDLRIAYGDIDDNSANLQGVVGRGGNNSGTKMLLMLDKLLWDNNTDSQKKWIIGHELAHALGVGHNESAAGNNVVYDPGNGIMDNVVPSASFNYTSATITEDGYLINCIEDIYG